MDIKNDQSNIMREAKIRASKLLRDAAYRALVRAQKRGAGPKERQRLMEAYDRAEDKLQRVQDAAREAKRVSMGLTPKVRGE